MAPIIPVLLVDDALVIVSEYFLEDLEGLIFKFETIHQEQHTACIRSAKEELDDRGGGEGLTGTGPPFQEGSDHSPS